jgi:hypothetical protein
VTKGRAYCYRVVACFSTLPQHVPRAVEEPPLQQQHCISSVTSEQYRGKLYATQNECLVPAKWCAVL